MPEFYDLCLRNKNSRIKEKAEKLGWNTEKKFSTTFLEADDWGELKTKIGEERQETDVLVFKGGDEKLNRKAAEDTRVDILLRPEKGRKDSGINHVTAKKAAENKVAIGFDFRQLTDNKGKYRSFILQHWERNLKLTEKYGTPYIITTGAEKPYYLRAPRDLAALISSLGFNGSKAVSKTPRKILERAERVKDENFVRPGEKVKK